MKSPFLIFYKEVFTYSFHKCFLQTYYVLDTAVDTGNRKLVRNQIRSLLSGNSYSSGRRQTTAQGDHFREMSAISKHHTGQCASKLVDRMAIYLAWEHFSPGLPEWSPLARRGTLP